MRPFDGEEGNGSIKIQLVTMSFVAFLLYRQKSVTFVTTAGVEGEKEKKERNDAIGPAEARIQDGYAEAGTDVEAGALGSRTTPVCGRPRPSYPDKRRAMDDPDRCRLPKPRHPIT